MTDPTHDPTQPAPAAAHPALSVHIDTLHLTGFPPTQHAAIAAAIAQALSNLLSERERPAAWQAGAAERSIPHLDGGTFTLPHDASPTAIGAAVSAQIAAALDEGWSDAR